ncbi:hypothetical protein LMG22931_05419 [Paraburkholderia nemoris]|nr:hypothetical protein LMG22931_05419 [Paraburkholderia nemoris]
MPFNEAIEGMAKPRSICDRKGFEIPAALAVQSRVSFSRCLSARILPPNCADGIFFFISVNIENEVDFEAHGINVFT